MSELQTRRPIVVLPLVVNLAYAAALVILATVPSLPEIGKGVPDYWAHGIAYGMQAVLAYWLVWPLVSRLGATVLAWLGASILGCATEVLQSSIAARSAELKDVVADMVGALVVVMAVIVVRRLINLYRRMEFCKHENDHGRFKDAR